MNPQSSCQLLPRLLTLEETVRSILKQTHREHIGQIKVMEDTMERGFERMDQGFAELRTLIIRALGE